MVLHGGASKALRLWSGKLKAVISIIGLRVKEGGKMLMRRGGFYSAYKTEKEARDNAKDLRTPRGSARHGLGYPVKVTVQRIKHFGREGKSVWAVYIYKDRG